MPDLDGAGVSSSPFDVAMTAPGCIAAYGLSGLICGGLVVVDRTIYLCVYFPAYFHKVLDCFGSLRACVWACLGCCPVIDVKATAPGPIAAM